MSVTSNVVSGYTLPNVHHNEEPHTMNDDETVTRVVYLIQSWRPGQEGWRDHSAAYGELDPRVVSRVEAWNEDPAYTAHYRMVRRVTTTLNEVVVPAGPVRDPQPVADPVGGG